MAYAGAPPGCQVRETCDQDELSGQGRLLGKLGASKGHLKLALAHPSMPQPVS